MINKEEELKEAINSICENNNIKGHLFLYMDEKKIKCVGNAEMSALTPLLPALLKKWLD